MYIKFLLRHPQKMKMLKMTGKMPKPLEPAKKVESNDYKEVWDSWNGTGYTFKSKFLGIFGIAIVQIVHKLNSASSKPKKQMLDSAAITQLLKELKKALRLDWFV
uniref:Uncharacterized protein n=1 Tax=Romanomermis culicivorax TaxID=13658 RepID=A0A915JWD5_ROMCU